MIIVGSTAAKHWIPHWRDPQDMDVWCLRGKTVLPEWDSSEMPIEIMQCIPVEDGYATLDALYTIKLSHLGWDILWQKHVRDIVALQREGAVMIPELFYALYAHWQKTHKDKPYLSLYQKKGDFFNDHVNYVYDHDFLHECVSGDSEPLYRRCLQDGQEVMIDRHKFEAMSHQDQVDMFREEITVIAFERWIIPKHTRSWMKAYQWALRKTMTSLTKGWATMFCILNIFELKEPKIEYIKNIASKIKEGEGVMPDKEQQDKFRSLSDDLWGIDINVALAALLDVDSDSMEYDIADSLYSEHEEFASVNYSDAQYKVGQRLKDLRENLPFKIIESKYDGDEYGGEFSTVFEYAGDTYRIDYGHTSHSGIRYDNIISTLRLVTQVEKTVTVWE